MNQNSTTYDIVIIGGGIAGLYLAVKLVKKYKVALAEKYSKFGGRTFTFHADISGIKYQWEEGAARISDSHRMTLSLIKKYGLTTTQIGREISYKESGLYKMEPNHFEPAIRDSRRNLVEQGDRVARKVPEFNTINTQIPRRSAVIEPIQHLRRDIHMRRWQASARADVEDERRRVIGERA